MSSSESIIIKKLPRRIKRQFYEENNPSYKIRMEKARRELSENLEVTTLQKLRLSKGLSQSQLAKLIGTTQPHIAKIESRQVSLYGETLKRLADVLDVTMETVYDLTKKMEIDNTKRPDDRPNYFCF